MMRCGLKRGVVGWWSGDEEQAAGVGRQIRYGGTVGLCRRCTHIRSVLPCDTSERLINSVRAGCWTFSYFQGVEHEACLGGRVSTKQSSVWVNSPSFSISPLAGVCPGLPGDSSERTDRAARRCFFLRRERQVQPTAAEFTYLHFSRFTGK